MPTNTSSELRSAIGRKTCLHPDAPSGCSRIGLAHTVQRATALNKIASNGHVYVALFDLAHQASMMRVDRPPSSIPLQRMGVGKASAFSGFCSRHDDELFAAIEKKPMGPDTSQAFLAHFRALCFEIYQKKVALECNEILARRSATVAKLKEAYVLFEAGMKMGLADLFFQKQRLDSAFRSRQFDSVTALFYRLSAIPSQMCCGAFAPEWDVTGRKLMDLIAAKPRDSQSVGLTISADNLGGYALVTGDQSGTHSHAFLAALERVERHRVPNLLLRLALQQIENVLFAPAWWEGVTDQVRKEVLGRSRSGQNFGLFNKKLVAPVGWRVNSVSVLRGA
jgi:hypothetical protein